MLVSVGQRIQTTPGLLSLIMKEHRITSLETRDVRFPLHEGAGSLIEADEILVLDSGRVCERGTHSQLLAADSLYRRMFDVQNGMLALEKQEK